MGCAGKRNDSQRLAQLTVVINGKRMQNIGFSGRYGKLGTRGQDIQVPVVPGEAELKCVSHPGELKLLNLYRIFGVGCVIHAPLCCSPSPSSRGAYPIDWSEASRSWRLHWEPHPESSVGRTVKAVDRQLIDKRNANVEGQEMAPLAMDALRNLDYSPIKHSASNLTLETIDRAHLVFCMTDAQVAQVKEHFPSSSAKALRLHHEIDIPNPAGKGLLDFEYVADLLCKALDRRMGLIASV